MIEGDFKGKTKKNMPARDETTRTPGIKLRHENAERKEAKKQLLTKKQVESMDHMEQAQVRGLLHRSEAEKGIKK